AELDGELVRLRSELQNATIGAEELGLEAAATRGPMDALAKSADDAGNAAAASAGGIRTLSAELAELSPRILATTLAANLLQQAAGVRGIGSSVELLRSTADAIGAIQQQF